MSIRARLTIAVIIAFVLAAAGVVVVLGMRGRLARENERHELVQEMLTRVLALNVLRADYQLYRNERPRRQWESEHAELADMLDRAKDIFPEGDPVITSLIEANKQRVQLFRSLVSTYGAQEGGLLSPDIARDTETRLVGSMLVLSQSAIDDVNLLASRSKADLDRIQAASTSATISLIVILAVVVLVLSILVDRTVLQPLRELERGTEAVGRGDFDYRIGLTRNDEIGRAARAFDSMTGEIGEHRDSLEELVRSRTEDLERANLELDAYSRAVSHDLRNPLASATVAASMLMEASGEPDEAVLRREVMEAADVVARNLEKAHGMVSALLRIAEAGQLPIRVEEVSVSDVVGEVVSEQQSALEAKGMELYVDPDLGTIWANRVQVYQVFSNLIGNAIKHNDNPEPRVSVNYFGLEEGLHRYAVCDNGSKLKDSNPEKLFKPFYKSSRTSDIGIGLSIVDKVIRSYGGWISVSAENGACFEFAIPDWEGEERD